MHLYIRKNIETIKHDDGSTYVKQSGNVIGVMTANLIGDNIEVCYSLLHEKDMSKRQQKEGISKEDRANAIVKALEKGPMNIVDRSRHPREIHKLLSTFLIRCAFCFSDAKTINGQDITPYKRNYT